MKLWIERPVAPRIPTRSPARAATASSRSWRTSRRSTRKKPRKPAATRAVARLSSPSPFKPSGRTSSSATATTTPPVSASRVGRRSLKRRPILPPIRVATTVSPASGIAIGTSVVPLAAARADPAQEDVMGGDAEVGPLAYRLDRLLQGSVREGLEATAADADHVVVVPAGVVALEGDHLAADVDAVHEPQLLELLERPVDARPPDVWQPPVDLQRRHRAALPAQQLDHPQPCRTGAEACFVQPRRRPLGPDHRPQPI